MTTDILDEIDAVLNVGEPEIGYYFDDPKYPRCPRGCGRPWHGMALTRRIQQMHAFGQMDPEYRYAEDDSEVLCPAPDFIGPHRPPGTLRPKLREVQLSFTLTPEIITQYQAAAREAFEGVGQALRAFFEGFAPALRELAAFANNMVAISGSAGLAVRPGRLVSARPPRRANRIHSDSGEAR